MAFNAFIQIDGIKGEATEDKHKDWIEIADFNLGHSQQSLMTGGAYGRQAGKADFEPVTFRKMIDSSSPTLALHCANGTQIAKVTIEASAAAGEKTKFASVILEHVMVAGFRMQGNPSGEVARPTEEVSLVFDKITWSYWPIKDGKQGAEVKQGWDIAANKRV
jgi:type VI secretion system secreted protein Hcp